MTSGILQGIYEFETREGGQGVTCNDIMLPVMLGSQAAS
jgi:hypothetical protein